MLYHLLYPLKTLFSPFNLFRYVTFRTAYATLTAVLITFILIPIFIRWMEKRGFGENISEYVPESHRKKEGTATAGGVVLILSTVISVLLWANLSNSYIYIAMFTIVFLGILGFVDDITKLKRKRGLSKGIKLLYQSTLSAVVFLLVYLYSPKEFATSTQFLFFKNIYLTFGILYLPFIFFVFVGATNAVNLTDGLDGLAVGSALAPVGVFIAVSYITGHKLLSEYLNILYIPYSSELTVFAGALLGALLGFLWYNTHPAQIFMGDTGSQALGGAFGILAILTKQEILLAIACGVFVIETLSVIIQVAYYKLTNGKRIFKMAPLHHHLEKMGWQESKIVVRFWVISMFFALLALSTLKIR